MKRSLRELFLIGKVVFILCCQPCFTLYCVTHVSEMFSTPELFQKKAFPSPLRCINSLKTSSSEHKKVFLIQQIPLNFSDAILQKMNQISLIETRLLSFYYLNFPSHPLLLPCKTYKFTSKCSMISGVMLTAAYVASNQDIEQLQKSRKLAYFKPPNLFHVQTCRLQTQLLLPVYQVSCNFFWSLNNFFNRQYILILPKTRKQI